MIIPIYLSLGEVYLRLVKRVLNDCL